MSQNYVVTGALGCIGGWVVKQLLDRGDTPIVFDLPGDPRRIRELVGEEMLSRVRFENVDITDLDAFQGAIADSGARRIVHLAGLQVPFCKADPAKGALVNVLGTIHVLEVAKRLELDGVVYASSGAVYGPPEGEINCPTESDVLEPTTHYGVFKKANEGNARIYAQDDGVRSVGLRPLTVYGVGRDQGMTSGPTTAMRALVRGEASTIAFSGTTDFLYVADCAAAFLTCVDNCPEGAPVFNLSGQSLSVLDFVATVEKVATELGLDASGKISIDGPELPIVGALDGAALKAAFPQLQRTKVADAVRETLKRFIALEERL